MGFLDLGTGQSVRLTAAIRVRGLLDAALGDAFCRSATGHQRLRSYYQMKSSDDTPYKCSKAEACRPGE
jgi:hypothetical protein